MFRRAIVRKPGANFSRGITTSGLGPPDLALAVDQHSRYCAALEGCGLEVIELPPKSNLPDSTFVEDVAVLTPKCAILTRPGAESRADEVKLIREPLSHFCAQIHEIQAPGTLDGGDICQAENHYFIGLSHRTNEAGGKQLAAFLAIEGYTSSFVEIRNMDLLHLKSGVTYVGDHTLVMSPTLAEHDAFRAFMRVVTTPAESYAANCVRVNRHVLVPAGFPQLYATLLEQGFDLLRIEMSEFRKMDGGLSCLSLRF